MYDRLIPFNDLPPLPPTANLETNAILKMAIRASKALEGLRVAGELIPNQSVLIQILGLSEAKLSSEIENIVTTDDELYRAFADGDLESNSETKEVLFYKNALWYGYDAIVNKKRQLTTPLFIELMQILKNSTQGIRTIAGTKLVNGRKEVMYTPPEGKELIQRKLSELEHYIHMNDSLDPLVQMALIHYQFEAIHPFSDGNGRTGRILNILFLIMKGVLDIPVLYLSRYIISNKAAYYNGLKQVTEHGAWEEWVIYILKGLEETAIATKKKILDIHRLSQETAALVRAQLPRIYSKDLIEVLFRSPYCKIRFLEEAGIAKRQTASEYLQQLEKVGVLRSMKIGRDIYYLNDAFLKLLVS